MKILEILLEDRKDFIAKQWGDKIIDRIFGRNGQPSDYSGDFRRLYAEIKQHYKFSDGRAREEFARDTVDLALSILSQAGEQHIQWITKQWLAGRFKFEDVPMLQHDIGWFEDIKRTLPLEHRDLNRLPDLQSLYDLLSRFGTDSPHTSKRQQDKSKRKNLIDTNEAEMFYDADGVKIIVPKTQAASCEFGKGTKWCTAATNSNNLFNDYTRDHPLYIIHVGNHKYQLGWSSADDDSEENVLEFVDEYAEHPCKPFDDKYNITKDYGDGANDDLIYEIYDGLMNPDIVRSVCSNPQCQRTGKCRQYRFYPDVGHFQMDFMDEIDQPVQPGQFVKQYPQVRKALAKIAKQQHQTEQTQQEMIEEFQLEDFLG